MANPRLSSSRIHTLPYAPLRLPLIVATDEYHQSVRTSRYVRRSLSCSFSRPLWFEIEDRDSCVYVSTSDGDRGCHVRPLYCCQSSRSVKAQSYIAFTYRTYVRAQNVPHYVLHIGLHAPRPYILSSACPLLFWSDLSGVCCRL